MANPVIALIMLVLNLYWWVVIIAVIVSWLIAFNVINTYNNFVRSLLRALAADSVLAIDEHCLCLRQCQIE